MATSLLRPDLPPLPDERVRARRDALVTHLHADLPVRRPRPSPRLAIAGAGLAVLTALVTTVVVTQAAQTGPAQTSPEAGTTSSATVGGDHVVVNADGSVTLRIPDFTAPLDLPAINRALEAVGARTVVRRIEPGDRCDGTDIRVSPSVLPTMVGRSDGLAGRTLHVVIRQADIPAGSTMVVGLLTDQRRGSKLAGLAYVETPTGCANAYLIIAMF